MKYKWMLYDLKINVYVFSRLDQKVKKYSQQLFNLKTFLSSPLAVSET